MTREELHSWNKYLNEETPDIQEMQMAVMSNMIARYAGSKTSKFNDFLIRKPREISDDKPISNSQILATFQSLGAK